LSHRCAILRSVGASAEALQRQSLALDAGKLVKAIRVPRDPGSQEFNLQLRTEFAVEYQIMLKNR
jgi:hypothetical protein